MSFEVDNISGWLVRQPDGRVDAFYAQRPHLGCGVEIFRRDDPSYSDWRRVVGDVPAFFRDECHSTVFLLSGERVFGPAPRSLDRLAVEKVEGSRVTIDVGRLVLGTCGPESVASDAPVNCSRPGRAEDGGRLLPSGRLVPPDR